MSLSIASWNVNSVRSRLPHVLDWLREASPDVVLLQELKTVEEQFPLEAIEELGYQAAIFGQKTYNGVAILSKHPIEDITKGFALPSEYPQEDARYIEAVISAPKLCVRVASVYVPNGQAVGSDKFTYKLAFLEAFREHAKRLLSFEEMLVIGGDWNVAPEPLDVFAPGQLEGSVCFHEEERTRFHALCHAGLHDAYRLLYPSEQHYSWWDYRAGAWQQNKGMRIDHLLISPEAADRLKEVTMDSNWRAKPKASDHVPVTGVFTFD